MTGIATRFGTLTPAHQAAFDRETRAEGWKPQGQSDYLTRPIVAVAQELAPSQGGRANRPFTVGEALKQFTRLTRDLNPDQAKEALAALQAFYEPVDDGLSASLFQIAYPGKPLE